MKDCQVFLVENESIQYTFIMKELFSFALLAIAVSFFSQRFVFRKRIGLVSLAGIEIYVLGVLFSFVMKKEMLISITTIIFVILGFIGFLFGIQFNKQTVEDLTLDSFIYGFVISLQFFVFVFVIHFFLPFDTTVLLSTIFSVPASYLVFKIKNERFILSIELSTVIVGFYYCIMYFGFSGFLYALLFGLLAFLFVQLEKFFTDAELFVLLSSFLLVISGVSQLLHFSAVFSSMIFGMVIGLFSKFDYVNAVRNNFEQPMFLILLFLAGLHFAASFLTLLAFAMLLPVKLIITFSILKRKATLLVPIGALSIAIAMESMSSKMATFTTILYFILITLFELFREKTKWDI